MNDDPEGPAFDTNTLGTPTPRKLVCCWMEQSGLRTTVLPEVWTELTRQPSSVPARRPIVESWRHVRSLPDNPFLWCELDDDQREVAGEALGKFTQACFPRTRATQIPTLSDAIIIAEAVAVGAEALVTGDINTIDHYEVNGVLSKAFGRNREFVTTLDNGLCRAHPCADAAERLLILALSTIAPAQADEWPVDDAHEDLQRLRKALAGSNLVTTSDRLENRWNQSRNLEAVLEQATDAARSSRALRIERQRSHGFGIGRAEPAGNGRAGERIDSPRQRWRSETSKQAGRATSDFVQTRLDEA